MMPQSTQVREWLVTCDIRMSGATAIVEAATEEEARRKFEALHTADGIDTAPAELTHWNITAIEENV